MVMNNDSWEEQTRRYLAEAQSELKAIDAEIGQLQDKSIMLTRAVGAYEAALQDYLRRTGKKEAASYGWVKQLSSTDLTHKKRLIAIAEHNGGKIRVSQASDLLYNEGIIKSKKRANAYTIVQALLADMVEEGKFEKIKPGEYSLIGAQQSLPGVS